MGAKLGLANASNARQITPATLELLHLAEQILPAQTPQRPLVVADTEHFAVELLDEVRSHNAFDLLVPLRQTLALQRRYRALPDSDFTRHWAGCAVCGAGKRF